MPTLKQLAGGMRQALDWAQQVRKPEARMKRTLPNGLQIVYSYEGDRWMLALSRENVHPSAAEVDAVRADFGVPESAWECISTITEEKPVTGRRVKWSVISLIWREQIPASGHLPRAASTYAPVEGSDSAVWGANASGPNANGATA